MATRRTVGVLLFEGFEVLDVFGPVELLSKVPEEYELRFLAPVPGPVRSAQGVEVVAADSLADDATPDIVLVPGGVGTRTLVEDEMMLSLIAEWASPAEIIASVCTGSGVLAAAGLLDGHRATSNKAAFGWASNQGTDVRWVPQARWVQDRNRWTSSGVAAGMDMTAALIAHLSGPETSRRVTDLIELDVHEDAGWDPFAEIHGLV